MSGKLNPWVDIEPGTRGAMDHNTRQPGFTDGQGVRGFTQMAAVLKAAYYTDPEPGTREAVEHNTRMPDGLAAWLPDGAGAEMDAAVKRLRASLARSSHRIDREFYETARAVFVFKPEPSCADFAPWVALAPKKPEPTPEEKWAEHLRQERAIAAAMVAKDYPLAGNWAWAKKPESFERGYWQPSTSGLAGGSVGVWRRR